MNQASLLSAGNTPVTARRAQRLPSGLLLGLLFLVAACGSGAPGSGAAGATSAPTSAASPAVAGALQNDFIGVVGRVSPSVVVIQTPSGLGSGIVYDAGGDIVTNNHVVAGSTTFSVTTADGSTLPGTLVGTYPAGDIAVIHVASTNLQPATFGDSSQLVVGDIVLAVGNPLGLQGTVTEGIVSALRHQVPESSTVTLPNMIQTSASINPGNSGGALVDLGGSVVGIPTLAAIDPNLGNSAAPGIGFAIPSNTVVNVADQLIASGRVTTVPSPGASPVVP
jgi:S1-C subfamily serine protease